MATIKGRLALLASGLVGASLLAAALLVQDAQRRARLTFEAQLQETARALSLVVEGHLRLAGAFNAALASSPALETGDLAAFADQARRAAAGRDAWVVLSGLDGRQLVNTRAPTGAALPRDPVAPGFVERLRAGETVVSNVMPGAVAGGPVLAVDSPVFVRGELRYDLSYVFTPGAVRNLLLEQNLPGGHFATVLDGRDRVVARTRDNGAVGRSATPDVIAALEKAPEGVMESRSLDGDPTLLAYSRLSSGWSVLVVVPREQLTSGVRRSYLLAAIGALAIIGIGGMASFAVAGGISGPIGRLSRQAEAVGRGDVVPFETGGIEEIDAVGRALAVASAKLRQRERDLAASLERQQLAFSAARIGTWDIDIPGGRRFWSSEFRAVIGIDDDVEPDAALFAEHILPDDRDRVVSVYGAFFAPGGPDSYLEEFRFRRPKDGEVRWVRTEGRMRRDADGRALRATGTILDITDMRRDRAAIAASEQRLRIAVTSAPFPLMLEAAGGGIQVASQSWWESSGQDGSAVRDTVEWASLALGGLPADAAADGFGYQVPEGEATIRLPDGGERIWDFREVALDPLPDGRPLRLVAAVDVTERERDARRLGLLVGELNHRVKNTLAKVQAIASRTALTTRDPDEFAEKLGARLRALARTHDLLTTRHWEGIAFRDLLEAELSPFQGGGTTTLDGPDVRIGSDIAVSLSLLIHELATNAVKHGCLAAEGGRLHVEWDWIDSAAPGTGFRATWVERCLGADIRPPTRRGFGSRLIASTLKSLGSGTVDYVPEGLVCRMEVRLDA